jgi:hypothetical protein
MSSPLSIDFNGILAMSKQKHYINNPDFLKALTEYKEICKAAEAANKEVPPIPNYIGECWMKIAENLSHKPNFVNYPHREDMIGDGIENCLMYFRNFNPERSKNPFAYFTQIIWYAFIRRITKEKKQLYKATEQFGILDEHDLLDIDGNAIQFQLYDNISEFIETFEEAKRNKKKPVAKPKGIENFLE